MPGIVKLNINKLTKPHTMSHLHLTPFYHIYIYNIELIRNNIIFALPAGTKSNNSIQASKIKTESSINEIPPRSGHGAALHISLCK